MSKDIIKQVVDSLLALIESNKVMLWSTRLDVNEDESPSAVLSIVKDYWKELTDAMELLMNEGGEIEREGLNLWLQKFIFLRNTYKNINFNEDDNKNTEIKENTLRELAILERKLINLRNDL